MRTQLALVEGSRAERAHKGKTESQLRFDKVVFKLRGSAWNQGISREDQEEIAHLIHKIETTGFGFFASHFILDDIEALEKIEKRVKGEGNE